MIERIVSLTNIGRFENYKHKGSLYDRLPKNVVIYAENGSGKTTLSILFKSLKGDNTLLIRKQTFGTTTQQEAKILIDGKLSYFTNGSWSINIPELEIFDVHFIEDNLYVGSLSAETNKSNLFEYIVGKEGTRLSEINRIKEAEWSKLFHEQILLQNPPNASLLRKHEKIKIYAALKKVKAKMRVLRPMLTESRKELGIYTKQVFELHIAEINKQLSFFAPYIKVKRFANHTKKMLHQLSYYLRVNDTDITFDLKGKAPSVKYSLSEGDKSAVALAFFLSKIYNSPNINEKVIIFDDPISSFDANRRNATINQLQNFSSKVKQLIVLTHDIYFARDLKQRLPIDSLSLKLVRKSKSSVIVEHDIYRETLGGLFKDINTLSDFVKDGAESDERKREVIRCIRPIIEGIIRIKYFDVVNKGEWLGDFIAKTRDSKVGDGFYALKSHLGEITELNEYSKHFHHSEPGCVAEAPVNESELYEYSRKTLELIKKI